MGYLLEFIIIGAILIFIFSFRNGKNENVYKFVSRQVSNAYEKFAPYTFKVMREKTKELGQEYTPKQYGFQVLIFSLVAGVVGYLYNYSLIASAIYVVVAVSFIPYLAYLRCKRVYSEFIFEQIQVYTTNVIMEFATTNAFVKSLEGVVESGVLEDPVLSDVKKMIELAYAEGDVRGAINYMNTKYPFFIVKNMHQLFLQVTKEGAKDTRETFENMLSDIDMLVENVYRDRLDRKQFHKQFLFFGVALYGLVMVAQLVLSTQSYIKLLDQFIIRALVNLIIIINSGFLIFGEKYYNEDVGAE